MCSCEDVNAERSTDILKPSLPAPSFFEYRSLPRLKALSRRLQERKPIASAADNQTLFASIFHPQRLLSLRHAGATAAHFWGHRQNETLDELLVEAGLYTYISKWRKAHIAARHQDNALFIRNAADIELSTLLCRVVENLRGCTRLLAEMATDDSAFVRISVSENFFTDLKTMFQLAADRNPDVRFAIAENHNAPIAVLQFLTDDGNPYVASRAQKTISRLIGADAQIGLLNRLTRAAKRQAAISA